MKRYYCRGYRREAVFKILRKSPDIEITEIKSDFSLEKTEILVDEYLKNNSPDCIVSATDNMAFGAMKAIYRHGYKNFRRYIYFRFWWI